VAGQPGAGACLAGTLAISRCNALNVNTALGSPRRGGGAMVLD